MKVFTKIFYIDTHMYVYTYVMYIHTYMYQIISK